MAAIAEDGAARPGRPPAHALERPCLNTRRGLAFTGQGNRLTEAQPWAKVRVIRDIAGGARNPVRPNHRRS
jgi:hypothetical protein